MSGLDKKLKELDAAGLDPALIQNHIDKKRKYQHGRSDDHHLALSLFSAQKEAWKKEFKRREAMERLKERQTANVGSRARQISANDDDGYIQAQSAPLPAWSHPVDNVDDLVDALESIPADVQERLRKERQKHSGRIIAKGLRHKAVQAYLQAMMQTGYFRSEEEAKEIILQSIQALRIKRRQGAKY